MTELIFLKDSPFECLDAEIRDATFIKATRIIGGRDAMEEYLARGPFPLSVSFGLGEVADGETPVSKLSAPMPDFWVARFPEETNVGF
jgi:hypothetical protein